MKRILCAVDFSDFSKAALLRGVELAWKWDARLFVFHAVSFPRGPYHGRPRTELDYRPGQGVDLAVKKINAMVGRTDVRWEPVVVSGDPVEELIEQVHGLSIDLLVAASYGLSGIKRLLIGTVVEQMVRHLALPIWVLRHGKRADVNTGAGGHGIRKIVAGYDPAVEETAAFREAARIARRFDAELHVVGAMASPFDESIVNPTQAPYEEVQETLMERTRQHMETVVSSVLESYCNHRVAVLPGAPEEVLRDYALENRADLIAVGVRPESAVKKILIGSTTEAMLRRAPCDVLTVPSSGSNYDD
jgi:nucleotide-binding universal stress UspA family protein